MTPRTTSRRVASAGAVLLGAASLASAADIYVATTGDDGGPGTSGAPFATVQRGIDAAQPGDTVIVRPGAYPELVEVNVSGDASLGWITIRAESPGTADLVGTGLAVEGEETFLLRLTDVHHVRVEGLEVRGLQTNRGSDLVGGILVESVAGTAHDIEIVNCAVGAIGNFGAGRRDAHGIAVYGRSATPITNVTIEGCVLQNLVLGTSEALVVNGNVDGFAVLRNVVIDCDNIGIDAIGFEGTAPSDDSARNGVIRGNDVFRCSGEQNPSYRGDLSADGIYVDGGRDILIEGNVVNECDIGIEVASEAKGGSTSGVIVRSNLLIGNKTAGLACGGYSPARGTATDCSFVLNTLVTNDTYGSGQGEILVQKANGVSFTDNVVLTSSQNLGVTSPFKPSHTFDVTFARNVWWSQGHPAALRFEWNRKEFLGLSAFAAANGGGAGSVVANPLLPTSGGGLDFRPFPDSPAIDAGDPGYAPGLNETDVLGRGRKGGAAVDRGAFETGTTVVTPHAFDFLARSFTGVEGQELRARLSLRGGDVETALFDPGALPVGLAYDVTEFLFVGPAVAPAEYTSSLVLTFIGQQGVLPTDLSITVLPSTSADRDGDGFPNGLEESFDVLLVDDGAATPVGAAPIVPVALTPRKLGLLLKATRTGPREQLILDATLPFDAALADPAALAIDVGGLVTTFEPAGAKRATSGGGKVRLSRRGDELRVRMKLKPTEAFALVGALQDEGFFASDVPKGAGVTIDVLVFVVADGVAAADLVTVGLAGTQARKMKAALAK